MGDLLERIAQALWDSTDDHGIAGRLFREDCDYLAGVAIEALRPMDELRTFTQEELSALPRGTVLLDSDGDALQKGGNAWAWAGEDHAFSSWALANSNFKYRLLYVQA